MKKNLLNLLVLIIITVSLLVGCSDNQELSPDGNNQTPNNTQQNPNEMESLKLGDFFPLELGYSWEYQGEGNEFASFKMEVVYSDNDLRQVREDNGGTVSASVYKVSSSEIEKVFFQAEAYDESNYLNNEPNEEVIILKTPLEVGAKWQEPNGTREIVSINETVSTPAGDFDKCIKVSISSKDSTIYEYYKEGIGMVKREFIFGEDKITSSLKAFSKNDQKD